MARTEECSVCQKAINALNGKFCKQENQYVEYEPVPPCKIKKKEE